jgi:hypothetical protein
MRIPLHRILSLLLASALSLSASAQVYKCVDGAGKTAYQSQPCPEATKSAQLDVRSVSSLPDLSANASIPQLRQAVVSSCMAQSSRSAPPLARIAAEQPGKFRSFCECSADSVLAQMDRVKDMINRGDRAGMERLGIQAGLACAPRLQ